MDPKFGCLMNIFNLFVFLSINSTFGFSIGSRQIAPEITESQKLGVKKILNLVYGDESSEEWNTRRSAARASGEGDNSLEIPQHELVYGELGLDALVTVLDAVGVMKGDRFIDIGSGDGMLVSAASMLFPDYIDSSVGVEIVPDLHLRSVEFQSRLEAVLKTLGSKNHNHSDGSDIELCPSMSLNLGNIYEPNERIQRLFSNSTLAICFATTWSKGEPGRKLPRLSAALGSGGQCEVPSGARVVTIDGVLDHEKDGFEYGGQFKLFCPDTAPYSTARLYTKVT